MKEQSLPTAPTVRSKDFVSAWAQNVRQPDSPRKLLAVKLRFFVSEAPLLKCSGKRTPSGFYML